MVNSKFVRIEDIFTVYGRNRAAFGYD